MNMMFPEDLNNDDERDPFLEASGEHDISSMSDFGSILIVDDDDLVRDAITVMLEGLDFNCLHAKDGLEAIAKVERFGTHIRLIILDIMMDTMTGDEALPHLKHLQPNIPILVVTGFNDSPEAIDAATFGVDGFLQKPFTLAQLSEKSKLIA